MVYNVGICAIVAITLRIKDDTLISFAPYVAMIQIAFYVIMIVANGSISLSGTTLREGVSHNTFGMSAALMGTILCYKMLLPGRKSAAFPFFWIISVIVTLISGSRNAFLGLVISNLFLFLVVGKYNREGIIRYFKIAGIVLLGCTVVLIAIVVFGVDFSRFNYVELFETGGTNRLYLWSILLPEVFENYLIFGYGPSHHCSSMIIEPLINRTYSHSHNVILECLGELGIIGLVPFLMLLLTAFRTLIVKVKKNFSSIVILALLVELMVNGIGESMFADMVLWLVIGFALSKSWKSNVE